MKNTLWRVIPGDEFIYTDGQIHSLRKITDENKSLIELCKQQHEALLAAPYSEQKRKALEAYNKLFEK